MLAVRGPLLAVLLLGLLARAALLLWFRNEPLRIWDEQDYNTIAVNLATSGEFAYAPGVLTSIRPPLYPAFLATVYRLCGLENYQAVRIVQALMGLGLVLVVYAMAVRMFGARVAHWAAAVTCFYPSLLVYGNLLLTETLFTLLVCSACLVFQRSVARGATGGLALFGVILGLAALTRSVVWLFPPFVFLFLVLARGANRWPKRLWVAGVPVLSFAVTILPWTVRNTSLQHTFTTIDVMGGRNFMMGNYEYTPLYRAWDAISIDGERAWHRVLAAENPQFGQATQGQRDKLAMQRGLRFVFANPGLTLQRDLVKFLDFWQLERELVAGAARGWWGHLPPPAIVAFATLICASYAAVMISGVFGFVLAPPPDRTAHWFLFILVGFICAIHTLTFGHSRYHLPLMPLVILYSASALVGLRAIWLSRRRWGFWVAVAVAVLLIGGWIWQTLVIDLGHLQS